MTIEDSPTTEPTSPASFPPPVRRSAPFLAWGALLVILAVPLLLASAYAGLTVTDGYGQTDPSVPLAWFGWVALAAGAGLFSLGLLRFADHADRRAGVVITPK